MIKNDAAITSTQIESAKLVELDAEQLESANGGLLYIGTCMGESAGALGGWGAFEYCFAKGFGLI